MGLAFGIGVTVGNAIRILGMVLVRSLASVRGAGRQGCGSLDDIGRWS